MKSKTFRLFITSGLILFGTLLYTVIRVPLGLEANLMLIGAIATFAFGLSVAGLVIGLGEFKTSRNVKNSIGLIGNLVFVGLFILISVLALK